jgi:hypothetical protein
MHGSADIAASGIEEAAHVVDGDDVRPLKPIRNRIKWNMY